MQRLNSNWECVIWKAGELNRIIPRLPNGLERLQKKIMQKLNSNWDYLFGKVRLLKWKDSCLEMNGQRLIGLKMPLTMGMLSHSMKWGRTVNIMMTGVVVMKRSFCQMQ